MAAYVVGQKGGRRRELATIGVTVAVTHTVGVVVLGVAALTSSSFSPEHTFKWAGVVSGLLVVLVGMGLFRDRLRTYRARRPHPRAVHTHDDHAHGHGHGHEHPHPHEHEHPHPHPHLMRTRTRTLMRTRTRTRIRTVLRFGVVFRSGARVNSTRLATIRTSWSRIMRTAGRVIRTFCRPGCQGVATSAGVDGIRRGPGSQSFGARRTARGNRPGASVVRGHSRRRLGHRSCPDAGRCRIAAGLFRRQAQDLERRKRAGRRPHADTRRLADCVRLRPYRRRRPPHHPGPNVDLTTATPTPTPTPTRCGVHSNSMFSAPILGRFQVSWPASRPKLARVIPQVGVGVRVGVQAQMRPRMRRRKVGAIAGPG